MALNALCSDAPGVDDTRNRPRQELRALDCSRATQQGDNQTFQLSLAAGTGFGGRRGLCVAAGECEVLIRRNSEKGEVKSGSSVTARP